MRRKGDITDLDSGKLLIAEPFMQDGYFNRSVILLTDYHETGTVGFVLNHPLRLNINNLISDFPKFPGSVYVGGPVNNSTIFYVHTAGELLRDSKEIVPGVYWGGDFHELKFLISNKVIKPRDIKFFMGYSGWAPGQLEDEMQETNAWLVEDADPNYIFYNQGEVDLYKQIMRNKGHNFSVLASTPNQSLN